MASKAGKIQDDFSISYARKQKHIQGIMGTHQVDTESSMQ